MKGGCDCLKVKYILVRLPFGGRFFEYEFGRRGLEKDFDES